MTIVGTWEWPPGRARGAQSSPGHFLTEKGRGRSAFVWEREPGTVAVPTALPSPLPLCLPRDFIFTLVNAKKQGSATEGGNLLRALAAPSTLQS